MNLTHFKFPMFAAVLMAVQIGNTNVSFAQGGGTQVLAESTQAVSNVIEALGVKSSSANSALVSSLISKNIPAGLSAAATTAAVMQYLKANPSALKALAKGLNIDTSDATAKVALAIQSGITTSNVAKITTKSAPVTYKQPSNEDLENARLKAQLKPMISAFKANLSKMAATVDGQTKIQQILAIQVRIAKITGTNMISTETCSEAQGLNDAAIDNFLADMKALEIIANEMAPKFANQDLLAEAFIARAAAMQTDCFTSKVLGNPQFVTAQSVGISLGTNCHIGTDLVPAIRLQTGFQNTNCTPYFNNISANSAN